MSTTTTTANATLLGYVTPVERDTMQDGKIVPVTRYMAQLRDGHIIGYDESPEQAENRLRAYAMGVDLD